MAGILAAAIVVGGIIVLVVVGVLIQSAVGSAEGTITGPTVPPPDDCDDFCRDLVLARTRRCNEEAHWRALVDNANNLNRLMTNAMLTWLGLMGAAIAVAAIPFFGGWLSAGLWAAAMTAFALYWVLLGMAAAAWKQASDQLMRAFAAREAETAAQEAMMMNCPPEEQTRCLARLMPCP
jgi:hypothetical protein